ncbi:glycosyltransferase, partial [Thioclava sp. BHET1]
MCWGSCSTAAVSPTIFMAMRMAITDSPRAAVVIPHRDDLMRLRICLSALLAQPEAAMVEILVIDNGSVMPASCLAAEFPAVRFLSEHGPGAACARNHGVAESRAPLLVFTDSDCRPAADWLRQALELGMVSTGGVVAGEVRLSRKIGGAAAEAVDFLLGFDIRRYVCSLGFGVTANLLIPRAIFDVVGGFRPGLPEDRDWCERAARLGYRTRFAPDLIVHHPCRSSTADLRCKWRRITREGFARHCD